jgi:predicted CXXCH cytochrome family protein
MGSGLLSQGINDNLDALYHAETTILVSFVVPIREKPDMKVLLSSVILAILLLPFHSFAVEINCIECHGGLTQGTSVHAAVSMGCPTCHSAIDARNIPHMITNKIAKGLSSDQPDLCYGCHDKSLFEKKFVHPAVSMGCTGCHNPHASKYEKLLTADMLDLCYNCHDRAVFTKPGTHAPVVKGKCLACHLPHAADFSYLLNNPLGMLCDKCHEGKSSGKHVLAGYGLGDNHPTRGSINPAHPGKELSCTSCHSPHSSLKKSLLTNETQGSDNFCLMCHTKIMVRP